MTANLAKSFGLADERGALISDDYNKALAVDKKGDFVRLLVRRGDHLLYIAV